MYPSYSYSQPINICTKRLSNLNAAKIDDDDDDKTVVTSNCLKDTHGLLDSGASDHFLAVNSHVESSWPTTNKINVVIPNGGAMASTRECNINWPGLPINARRGHIIQPSKIMHSSPS